MTHNNPQPERTLRLISVPFRAVYTDARFDLTQWSGPNARLAIALLFNAPPTWPIRGSVFSLVDCGLRVGQATYPPGQYPPGTSIFMPPHQDNLILDLRPGSTIEGEILMEPLVLPAHLRKGVLEDPAESAAPQNHTHIQGSCPTCSGCGGVLIGEAGEGSPALCSTCLGTGIVKKPLPTRKDP